MAPAMMANTLRRSLCSFSPYSMMSSAELRKGPRLDTRYALRCSTSFHIHPYHEHRFLSTSRPSQNQSLPNPSPQSPPPGRLRRYARRKWDSLLRTAHEAALFYPSFFCAWYYAELAMGSADTVTLSSTVKALMWAKTVKYMWDTAQDVCHSVF